MRLEETLVRSVIIKHLTNQREKFLPQSGSGPDINFPDGSVLELKGSVFDWRIALEQFIRYAYTHSALKLALPDDALDLYRIQALASFEAGLKFQMKPQIRTYLIGERGNNRFSARLFPSVKDIRQAVLSRIESGLYHHPATNIDERIDNAHKVLFDLDAQIRRHLSFETASGIASEVELERDESATA
jgi:hypothetical protein